MLARRQLEQGDSLSHRTLRDRQTTQLRSFGGAAVVVVAAVAVALETAGGDGSVGAVNAPVARVSAPEGKTEDAPTRLSPSFGLGAL
jgi:hypothetical protein